MKRVSRLNENDLKRIVKRVIIEQDEPKSITIEERKDQIAKKSFVTGLENLLYRVKSFVPDYDTFGPKQNFENEFPRFKDQIEALLIETESMFDPK